MISLTYPSGRNVAYTYSAANRNTGVAFQNFNGVSNPVPVPERGHPLRQRRRFCLNFCQRHH